MNDLLRKILPSSVYSKLRAWRRQLRHKRFYNQKMVPVKIGDFELLAPQNHTHVKNRKIQPFRGSLVGFSAKFYGEKYPDRAMIDIGANIGDTAAMMASYSKAALILVEPSDYYKKILQNNSKTWPNQTIFKDCFVGTGESVSGFLHHWGGTAVLIPDQHEGGEVETRQLAEIAEDREISLIKIDTDGLDYQILRAGSDYLAKQQPGVVFEVAVKTEEEFAEALETFQQLQEIGYSTFAFCDDAGFYLMPTNSLADVERLLTYLWVQRKTSAKRVSHYDVLAIAEVDQEITEKLDAHYLRMQRA